MIFVRSFLKATFLALTEFFLTLLKYFKNLKELGLKKISKNFNFFPIIIFKSFEEESFFGPNINFSTLVFHPKFTLSIPRRTGSNTLLDDGVEKVVMFGKFKNCSWSGFQVDSHFSFWNISKCWKFSVGAEKCFFFKWSEKDFRQTISFKHFFDFF